MKGPPKTKPHRGSIWGKPVGRAHEVVCHGRTGPVRLLSALFMVGANPGGFPTVGQC
jgi:hypothetical protein